MNKKLLAECGDINAELRIYRLSCCENLQNDLHPLREQNEIKPLRVSAKYFATSARKIKTLC